MTARMMTRPDDQGTRDDNGGRQRGGEQNDNDNGDHRSPTAAASNCLRGGDGDGDEDAEGRGCLTIAH